MTEKLSAAIRGAAAGRISAKRFRKYPFSKYCWNNPHKQYRASDKSPLSGVTLRIVPPMIPPTTSPSPNSSTTGAHTAKAFFIFVRRKPSLTGVSRRNTCEANTNPRIKIHDSGCAGRHHQM